MDTYGWYGHRIMSVNRILLEMIWECTEEQLREDASLLNI